MRARRVRESSHRTAGLDRRVRLRRGILVDQLGGAQDLLGRDIARLACELVAAARAANALEHAFAHQRLQHRLEMTRRQAVSHRECLRRHGVLSLVQRDVHHGSDCKDAFTRQERHSGSP